MAQPFALAHQVIDRVGLPRRQRCRRRRGGQAGEGRTVMDAAPSRGGPTRRRAPKPFRSSSPTRTVTSSLSTSRPASSSTRHPATANTPWSTHSSRTAAPASPGSAACAGRASFIDSTRTRAASCSWPRAMPPTAPSPPTSLAAAWCARTPPWYGAFRRPRGGTSPATSAAARPTARRWRSYPRAESRPAPTIGCAAPSAGAASRLECRLETGRTHQIRVHLRHLGYPVIGDPLYGLRRGPPQAMTAAVREAGLRRQALHAHFIRFDHPSTGEAIRLVSQLPNDLRRLITHLESL